MPGATLEASGFPEVFGNLFVEEGQGDRKPDKSEAPHQTAALAGGPLIGVLLPPPPSAQTQRPDGSFPSDASPLPGAGIDLISADSDTAIRTGGVAADATGSADGALLPVYPTDAHGHSSGLSFRAEFASDEKPLAADVPRAEVISNDEALTPGYSTTPVDPAPRPQPSEPADPGRPALTAAAETEPTPPAARISSLPESGSDHQPGERAPARPQPEVIPEPAPQVLPAAGRRANHLMAEAPDASPAPALFQNLLRRGSSANPVQSLSEPQLEARRTQTSAEAGPVGVPRTRLQDSNHTQSHTVQGERVDLGIEAGSRLPSKTVDASQTETPLDRGERQTPGPRAGFRHAATGTLWMAMSPRHATAPTNPLVDEAACPAGIPAPHPRSANTTQLDARSSASPDDREQDHRNAGETGRRPLEDSENLYVVADGTTPPPTFAVDAAVARVRRTVQAEPVRGPAEATPPAEPVANRLPPPLHPVHQPDAEPATPPAAIHDPTQPTSGQLAIGARLVPFDTTEDRIGVNTASGRGTSERPTVPLNRLHGTESAPDIEPAVGPATPVAGIGRQALAEQDVSEKRQPESSLRQRDRQPDARSDRPQEAIPQIGPARGDNADSAPPYWTAATERTSPAREPKGAAEHAQPNRSAEPPAVPEPGKAPLAARNIRLEVDSGQQRVEVRMLERDGDVHLAVRTADRHLSGALRENLPELSARLEQTGFRTESWHTQGASRREMESMPGSREPDPQSQPDGRRRQGDPEPQHPKNFEGQPNRKEKGKDFEWLMASLRG